MVIPHSSDLSLWGRKTGEPENGVVGVACLSVLVQGGWELKRHGGAAQCVLLMNVVVRNTGTAKGSRPNST